MNNKSDKQPKPIERRASEYFINTDKAKAL